MEDKDIIQNTPPDNGLKTVDLNELLQSLDPEKREIVSRAIYAIEEQKAFSAPSAPAGVCPCGVSISPWPVRSQKVELTTYPNARREKLPCAKAQCNKQSQLQIYGSFSFPPSE